MATRIFSRARDYKQREGERERLSDVRLEPAVNYVGLDLCCLRLSGSFSIAFFGNSLVAIAAGEVGPELSAISRCGRFHLLQGSRASGFGTETVAAALRPETCFAVRKLCQKGTSSEQSVASNVLTPNPHKSAQHTNTIQTLHKWGLAEANSPPTSLS